jgi:hypothetical protein
MVMNRWLSASTIAVITAVSGVASAQQRELPEANASALGAAGRSVELTIQTGYAQGFGGAGRGLPSLGNMATAGGAVEVGAGYRLIPQLTLGVYASGGIFGRGDQVDGSTNRSTATAGFEADWHFAPAGSRTDPWVSLGGGWRGWWLHEDGAGTTAMHGWEIAKLQVGVDFRIDRAIAVSPMVGIDLNTFFTESSPASGGWRNVSNPNVNTFLFAGMQGRFDIATRARSEPVASR